MRALGDAANRTVVALALVCFASTGCGKRAPGFGWLVTFRFGSSTGSVVTNMAAVRCVR